MKELIEDHVTPREKALIAMGAAMGAGCRTCADKLYEIAVSLNIPPADMMKAFKAGLDTRPEAAGTMKRKVLSLIHPGEEAAPEGRVPESLLSLMRIASFTAANSAPDAVSEINKARSQGVSTDQIRICVSLGRMVRKNAIESSDREISELAGLSEDSAEEPCCPAGPLQGSACSCG